MTPIPIPKSNEFSLLKRTPFPFKQNKPDPQLPLFSTNSTAHHVLSFAVATEDASPPPSPPPHHPPTTSKVVFPLHVRRQ